MNDGFSPNVNARATRAVRRWFSGGVLFLAAALPLAAQNIAVTTRHAPSVNGRVEGSVQQLLGEGLNFNSGAVLTHDLLVPGTPTVQVNGSPNWQGVVVGTGSTSPTGFSILINSGVTLRHVRTRTNAVTIPSVPAPPASSGTRSVTISQAGQSAGSWATLRDLTLNSNTGQYTVPAGTYRNFTANSGSGFTLGVAGSAQPAVYSFQSLTLNSQSSFTIVGPVILQLANGFNANALMGASAHPEWLQIKITSGGVTLNSGSTIHGSILAPSGHVMVNGQGTLVGTAMSDRFTVNSGGVVRWANMSAGSGNQPPIATVQSVSTPEDVAKAITLAATDADGNALTFAVATQPAHGSVSGSGANVTYTPFANYFGPDSFTFTANDGTVTSQPATVSITVTPVNDAPVAQAQAVSATEDAPAPITLMGTDVDGNVLTYSIVTAPANGTLTGTGPNRTYVPAANFSGPDSFTFKVNDGQTDSAPGTVTINVMPVPDVPVAGALNITTPEDQWVNITLTGLDGDGDPLVFHIATSPQHGVLSGTVPDLVYTPAADFHGQDSFSYFASDATAASAPATVSITVTPVNDPPVAAPLTVLVDEDTAAPFTLPATDADGDALTYEITAALAHGTLSGTAPNLLYTPAPDFFGTDSLTFIARDAAAASAPAVVSFTVRGVNDAPVAHAQAVALSEDTTAPILLAASDVDGDPLSYAIVAPPAHGVLSGTAPNLTYTPAANFNGPDAFTFRVNDGALNSAVVSVTLAVAPVNDVPVAAPLVISGPEDQPLTVTLGGIDIDGFDLDFSIIEAPQHGTLAIVDAEVTYTPAPDFFGSDSFRYIASDLYADSDPAIVAITITPVNDAPVAAPQTLTVAEESSAEITLAATDVENDAVTYRVVTQPAHGTLTPGSQPSTLHYQPSPDYHGPDGFAFVANDGQLDSAPATIEITVTPANDAPTAQPGEFVTFEDTPVTITLTAADPEGDALTFAVAGSIHGTLTPGALPGQYLYTPDADFSGFETLSFTAHDGALTSAPAALSIEVQPINDAPTITATGPSELTAPAEIALQATATDDGDPGGSVLTVAWSKVSGLGTVTFANAASAVTTASYSQAGTYVLRATASDTALTASADVTVTVVMPNRPPVVTAGPGATLALTATANLTGTVTDDALPLGAPVTQQWTQVSGPGTTTFADPASATTTATFSAPGDYILRLRATDTLLTGQAEVAIHILTPNQPPKVEAGPPQTIQVDATATLAGQVTDDGLPRGAGLQTQWSKVTGPGSVTFTDPFAPSTTATFSAPGDYTLRLTANDSERTGSAEVEVTVAAPVNLAPTVNAGPDLTLTGTRSTPINASATDDGLPAGSALTLGWSKVTGPGSVSFNPPATAATIASFGASGTYVLRLDAADGALTSSDEVTVTVATPNRAPVVTAGPDQTLSDGLSGILAGRVTDDGLTTNGEVVIAWSKISGPGTITFSDSAQPATTATFSEAGSYVLRLTANDGEFVSHDEVQIVLGGSGTFSVTLSSPLPGDVCGAPANLLVAADVQGGEVPLVSVEFFANGQKIGQSRTAPYAFTWTDVPPGSYTLTAVGHDSSGASAVSPPVLTQITPLGEMLRGLRWEFPAGAEQIPGASAMPLTSSDQVVFGGDPAKLYRIALRFRGIVELRSYNDGANDGYYWQTGGTPGSPDYGGNRYHLSVVNPQGQVTAIYSLNRNYLGSFYPPNPFEAIATYSFPLDYTRSIELPGGSTLRLEASSEDGVGGNNRTGIVVPGVPPAPASFYGQFVQMDALSAAESALAPTTLQVDAGLDIEATQPDSVALSGVVSGAPGDATCCESPRIYWSKLTGPGLITFDPPEGAQTSAQFSRPGTYVLELNAVVNGAVATDRVTLTINPIPGSNQPPVVSAGPDQTLATAYSSLHGWLSDDDRPTVSGVTASWSKASGPGEVLFGNDQHLDTHANFTKPGVYVLRLTATDGALSAFDEVVINASASITMLPPPGLAGLWKGEDDASESVHGTAGTLSPGTEFCDGLVGRALSFSGNGSGLLTPVPAGNANYDVGAGGSMTIEGWINPAAVTYQQPLVEWGGGYGVHLWFSVSFGGGGPASLFCNLTDTNGTGRLLISPDHTMVAAEWQHVAMTYDRTTGLGRMYRNGLLIKEQYLDSFTPRTTGDVRLGQRPGVAYFAGCMDEISIYSRALSADEITAVFNAGTSGKSLPGGNRAPVVFAGADMVSTSPVGVAINGSATDDGLPAGSTLTSTWSQVSGPGSVAFTDVGAATTTATFSADGIYVLRLTATDGALTGSDDVTLRIGLIPPNQAPVVIAGPNLTGSPGQPLVLPGTATDDGLPTGAFYPQWNVLSGPAPVNFSSRTQPHTTATFPASGTYLLRLSASDGELTASDDVTIAIAPATNQAPVVNFGGPRSVPYGQMLTLAPHITDDGLPDGWLALDWRQTYGLAALQLQPQEDGSVHVTATAAGLYRLLLSASDGVLTGSDEVAITVTPAATSPPLVAMTAPGQGGSFPREQALTLQATASDPDTGGGIVSVAFYDGATLLGADSAPAPNGTARLVWTGASVGNHTLTAVATDVSGTTATSAPVAITITPARPAVELTYPVAYSAFAPADAVQLQANASPALGGTAITQVEFLVNGSVVGVDPGAPYATGWTAPAAPGEYTLTARATDGSGQTATSTPFLIRVAADPTAPLIADLDEIPGGTITEPTSLPGTVEGPTLASWKVEYRREGSDCAAWTTLSTGSQSIPAGGTLATLDPTLLLNGIYEVRLTARDAFGGGVVSSQQVVVEGGMKVGHFTVAFSDLQVSLAGLPLTVTRMYDSRERCPGDFGNGWKLDVDSIRLEKSHALGDAWEVGVTVGTFSTPSTYQLIDSAPHLLTVRMPDGEVLRFSPKLVMNRPYSRLASLLDNDGDDVGQVWLPFQYSQPLKLGYRPRGGTKGATLAARGYRAVDPWTGTASTIAGDAPVYVSEPYEGPISLATNENSAQDAAFVADATGWELTSKDGRKFFFDAKGRLESMRDPVGNVMAILRDGAGRIERVTHSSGKEIVFVRNAQGFITEVIDPAGNRCHYRYDAAGDLRKFYDRDTDPLSAPQGTQEFGYTTGTHYLTDLFDGKGVRAARNYYDADGRLERTVDAQGKETVFTHDVAGRTETIKDRAGNTTTHRYDTRGNVTRTEQPDGTVVATGYHTYSDGRLSDLKTSESITGLFTNNAGQLVQQTVTTLFSYEDEDPATPPANDGLLRKLVDPLGYTTRYSYDDRGNLLSVTDPLLRSTGNTYYPDSNLLHTTTDAASNVTTFTYDARGQMDTETRTVTVVDATGASTVQTLVTDYDYDASGYLVRLKDARNHVTTYENDTHGNRLFERTTRTVNGAPVNVVTEHAYDANDRLVKTWDAEHPRASGFNPASETVYDENGKPVETYDALRRKTTQHYNTRGLLDRTDFADTTTESTTYDDEGRREFSTDRRGKVTQTIYDTLGRVSETWFLGSSGDTPVRLSATTYDAAGRVHTSTDARAKTTTFIYDAAGRRTATIDALGHRSDSLYDDAGNLRYFTDAKSHTTEHLYDLLNRRTRTIFPAAEIWNGTVYQVLATETSTTYDELGRRTSETNQSGLTKRFSYDALGRLTSVTQPSDGSGQPPITSYSYDELGNQLTQTDANNHTTSYSYDSLGRRRTRTLPGTQSESMQYDAAGNLRFRTDFNGRTTEYRYDALNRLRYRIPDASLGEQTVEWQYTLSGRRERMIDASGTTIYGYDSRDRLETKATPQGTLGYSYDDAGNLTSIGTDTTDGASMIYTHDDLSRLDTVTDANSEVTDYGYDAVGNLQSVALPNGVTAGYGYNAVNRLSTLTHFRAGLPIASYDYRLHATGHRRSVSETLNPQPSTLNRNVAYDYDALCRLRKETVTGDAAGKNGQVSYDLDPVGNRLSRTSTIPGLSNQSSTYDANDRLNGETYDANGNTKSASATQLSTLNSQPLLGTDSYDAENRLVQRAGTLNSQPSTIHILYNGDGHKVQQSVTQNGITTVTSYLVDELNPTGYAQVVEEKTNGVLTRVYTYGHDLISQDAYFGTDWHLSYYGYDGHGNVRFLTDPLGQITDTYDYEAFGTLLATGGTTPNAYRYCGEHFDSTLGLYYLRARMMNPLTGRFWTADSFEGHTEEPAGLHKFTYAEADPANGVDPSGYEVEPVPTWSLGNEAHLLFSAFLIARTGAFQYYNTGLGTIFPDLRGKAGGRLRPDAVIKASYDPSMTGRFFELKPSSYRHGPRARAVSVQVGAYNGYLQARGYLPGDAAALVPLPVPIGTVTSQTGERLSVVISSGGGSATGAAAGAIVYYSLVPLPRLRQTVSNYSYARGFDEDWEFTPSSASLAVAKAAPTLAVSVAIVGTSYMAAVLARQMTLGYTRGL